VSKLNQRQAYRRRDNRFGRWRFQDLEAAVGGGPQRVESVVRASILRGSAYAQINVFYFGDWRELQPTRDGESR